MKKAKNLEEVRKSIRDDHMVIIETGNTQCASCTAIQKKLDAFLKEHSAIEEHPEIASQFNILSVPTICLFIDRKKYLSSSGYFSLENFFNRIKKYEIQSNH